MAQGRTQPERRVHFELGGKENPVVVFADADFEARPSMAALFHDLQPETGSVLHLLEPGPWSRASIHDRFADALAERVKDHQGSGIRSIPGPRIGPLIHPRHVEKVFELPGQSESWRARRCVAAAELAMQGAGNYVEPTLYTNAANRYAHRPKTRSSVRVLTVIPFKDEAEALRIANDVALRPHRLYLDPRRRTRASLRPRMSMPG